MNIRLTSSLAAVLFCLAFGTAAAEERVVRGNVVKVVPITRAAAQPSDIAACARPKPAVSAGLGALLDWDLMNGCTARPSTKVVTGYRVFYRWDDRTYSRTMAKRPGATVPLLVTID